MRNSSPMDPLDSLDPLDATLRRDEPIQPGAQFAQRVMAAVRQDVALPPPIAIPWRHLVAEIVACALLLGAGLVALLRDRPPAAAATPAAIHLRAAAALASSPAILHALTWSAAAVAGSVVLALLARRLLQPRL